MKNKISEFIRDVMRSTTISFSTVIQIMWSKGYYGLFTMTSLDAKMKKNNMGYTGIIVFVG